MCVTDKNWNEYFVKFLFINFLMQLDARLNVESNLPTYTGRS